MRCELLPIGLTLILLGRTIVLAADDRLDGRPTPDLETVRLQWQSWRSQFATLHVRGRLWDKGNVLKYNSGVDGSNEAWREEFVSSYDFKWSDQGAVRLDQDHRKAGQIFRRKSSGSNGSVGWIASTRPEDAAEKWDTIATYRPWADRPLAFNVIVSLLYPYWDSNVGQWFDQALMIGERPVVEGWVDTPWGPQLKISKRFPSDIRMELWLDPARNYLPVRAVQYRSDGDLFGTWRVIEFQTTDSGVVFPLETINLLANEPEPGFECRLDEVIANERFVSADFQPPSPDPGTQLMDHISGEISRVPGGMALSAASKAASSPPTTPVIALVPRSGNSLWIIGGSILLILSGFVVARWRRQS